LPDALNVVGIEDAIVADNPEILDLGLGDQHSVERITTFSRKPARAA
jgi:hypothetical protein